MAQLAFGAGFLWGERVDNKVVDPVTLALVPASGTGPIQFGITQKASVSWSFSEKPVYGQNQFPLAIIRGPGKVEGRASNAQFNMLLFSDLFFGLTPSIGMSTVMAAEEATAAATYVVSNATFFRYDLGVRDKETGDHLQRFDSPDEPGHYTVGVGGDYHFNGALFGRELIISYQWDHLALGRRLSITNQSQGVAPVWKATFFQETSPGQAGANTSDQPLTLYLNACTSSKLSLPNSAIDAWTIPDLDFQAMADDTGEIGVLSMVEL